MYRRFHADIPESLHAFPYFALGDIGGCFYGNNRQMAAFYPDGGGYDTGGVGAFLSGVGLSPGTGIAGNLNHILVLQRDGKGTA